MPDMGEAFGDQNVPEDPYTRTRDDLSDTAKREAIHAALGISSTEEMLDLTLDSMIILMVHVGQARSRGQENAIDLASQVSEMINGMVERRPGLAGNILALAAIRLAAIGPSVLVNDETQLVRATKGAKNLSDFGLI